MVAGWSRIAGLMGLILSLSACGFHLRGSVALPAVMEKSFVEAGQYRELGQALEQRLRGAGMQLVASEAEASAVIRLLGEQRQRRVIAVDTSGQASAYELSYTVSFELHDGAGETLLGRQSLSSSRDLNFDAANVLGKSREEAQIYEALREAAASSILQRIQYALPGQAP
ncbi:MAG: hypothetical protein HUJ29_13690 [Gammaproteobacteria bacterium]|nr:hypothetical protein [Gammaproteobacteria bacterium]